jgi:hypothetical protein
MNPRFASLLHFPGCAVRPSLRSVAVALRLLNPPYARCRLNSRRPFTSRASLPVLAIAVFPGLLCNTAFAATRTTSLMVSVTVAAGCQVSPALSAAEPTASAPNVWNAPVSVNCSLPVPYQVDISSNPQIGPGIEPGIEHGSELGIELAGLGSTSAAAVGLPGYAYPRDLDSLRAPNHTVDQPVQATGEPAYSLVGLSSGLPVSPQGADEGTNGNPDAPVRGTITVTIVY